MTGFESITKNVASTVQNINWEFTLNAIPVKSKNFELRTNFNLTIPRNKLLNSIDPTSPSVGYPLGYIRVTRYAGVNPSNGNYLVLDKNGNPVRSTTNLEESNCVSF